MQQSDLWPVVWEQETAIKGFCDKQSFVRFCPEVLYDRFGLFVENLRPHADEIDQEAALQLKGPHRASWEFNWSTLTELHYSDCPLYSLLKESRERIDDALRSDEIVEIKHGAFGISFNLKTLLTRFCIWWLRKVRKQWNGKT